MRRTFVALDIETTGLDADRDSIIEIGAVKFRADSAGPSSRQAQAADTWSTLVNPERPLPYKIQMLTGIKPQDVRSAPPLSAVTSALAAFVQDHPIVGHNVAFDLAFLRQHGILLGNPSIDTFQLASILLPQVPSYSLSVLADALGIKFTERHRALADAVAVKDLFLALVERGQRMDLAVLQEINRVAGRSTWPLKDFFRDLERDQARTAFTSNVREQLLAKGNLDGAALGLVLDQRESLEPLQPTEEKQLLDEQALVAMLGQDGLLAEHFPGYEYRPQQVEMLQAVVRAFNEGRQVLAEAGTGTGKSLAYLLPAIHFAVQNGRPVVVSTNTINLQDQLFNKDIPDLQCILPLRFKAALLKGRSNYLCLRKLALFRRSETLREDEAQVLAKILAWLPHTESGDSAELSLRDQEFGIWSRVQAEQESCLGDKCPHLRKGRCFLYRARHNAEAAHVIVVNHALLLSDALVSNRVLPEYHHLIVDEAHHLEARATEQFGFAINPGQARLLLASLSQRTDTGSSRGFLPSIPQHFRGSRVSSEIQQQVSAYLTRLQREVELAQGLLDKLLDALQKFVLEAVPSLQQSNAAYDQQAELTSGMRVQPAWSDIEVATAHLDDVLATVEKGLQGLHTGLVDLEDQDIPDYDDLLQEIISRLAYVRALREHLSEAISEPSTKQVYWFRVAAKDGEVALHAAPLHVGTLLQQNLFPKLDTLILTSATLSTAREFAYIRERLGLSDADELRVESPFDYASSTLLYLPTDIPEPAQPNYQNAVVESIVELCLATQGRALVLFTSYHQLKTTYYAVARPLEEAGIVLFGQGLDGSRRQLLERFKTTPHCVLFGTRSFWEGVDVVGPALSCLVIARLPFSVPSDPIFAARSRTFDDSFGEYAVPEAVLRFRQGFGRLIRSYSDRGIVVVLDRRILSKSYGQSFLASLPGCTVHRGPLHELPSRAVGWLEESQPGAAGPDR